MRKWNAILAAAILALFLLHAVLGGFQLLGAGGTALKAVAWLDLALIALHTAIGVKLTADTLRAQKRAGVSYFRANALFWTRRISGFAVMLLLGFHLTAFGYENADGFYRLRPFGASELAAQILLVLALALHILSNVKPALLSFGLSGPRGPGTWNAGLVLSVLLLFMAAAFVVYYLRWNVW